MTNDNNKDRKIRMYIEPIANDEFRLFMQINTLRDVGVAMILNRHELVYLIDEFQEFSEKVLKKRP